MRNFFTICILNLLIATQPLLAQPSSADFDLLQVFLNRNNLFEIRQEPEHRAKDLVELDQVFSKNYQINGDGYQTTENQEPKETCLIPGDCLWKYSREIFDKNKKILLKDWSPSGKVLGFAQDLFDKQDGFERLQRLQTKFITALKQTAPDSSSGNPSARFKVYVLRTQHPLEKIQQVSIDRLNQAHPNDFYFLYFEKAKHLELFELLGSRWQAAMVFNDQLIKDFVLPEQWSEYFYGKVSSSDLPYRKIIDAHVHITSGALARWLEIMRLNAVRASAAIALPKNLDYSGLDQSNSDILKYSQQESQKLMAFPMLSPQDPDALAKVKQFKALGMRGLKLISGHGDYFAAGNDSILDTAELRQVLQFCETQGIPILWHVNTHLYSKGFLRVLDDFPKLTVINPHFGGYLTYAPRLSRHLLQRYPNLYFDISLGTELMYVRRAFEDLSQKNIEWRSLMIEFADRFIFGTDIVATPSISMAHTKQLMSLYRSLLEMEKFNLFIFGQSGFNHFWQLSHAHSNMSGLNLPKETLESIYWKNAERIYGPTVPRANSDLP